MGGAFYMSSLVKIGRYFSFYRRKITKIVPICHRDQYINRNITMQIRESTEGFRSENRKNHGIFEKKLSQQLEHMQFPEKDGTRGP